MLQDVISHFSSDCPNRTAFTVHELRTTQRYVLVLSLSPYSWRVCRTKPAKPVFWSHGNKIIIMIILSNEAFTCWAFVVRWFHVIAACREQLQEAQYQAAKSNLVPCRNCSRRFAPDRVGVHERICKGPKKSPPGGAHRQNEDGDYADSGRWATSTAARVGLCWEFFIIIYYAVTKLLNWCSKYI